MGIRNVLIVKHTLPQKQPPIVRIAVRKWRIILRFGVARIMKNMAERCAMAQKNAKNVLVVATNVNVIFMKK